MGPGKYVANVPCERWVRRSLAWSLAVANLDTSDISGQQNSPPMLVIVNFWTGKYLPVMQICG